MRRRLAPQRPSNGSSAPSTRASSGSITGIPSRTTYASRSGRHISSIALPLPETRSGPLQIGQTSNSRSRLSIRRSLRHGVAFFNSADDDVQQAFGLALIEACRHRDVPMSLAGKRSAFYGILLRHEDRLVVAEVDVGARQARMIVERTSENFDPAGSQHIEEPLGVADARDRMDGLAGE